MNASLTTILLATDGSSDAALAGQAAADISRKTGAQLHVVHVWTDVPPPAYPALVFDDYSRQAEEEARELLRRQVWNAQVAGGSVAGHHLREGRPAEEIIFLAERLGADLVVVGRRGVGRIKRLITGSVSEGVVHRASCPVLVVRGGEQAWPPARIVVGDDGSLAAMKAGGLAMELADAFGTEVVFVRACRHPAEPVGGRSARQRLELDEARLQNLLALDARPDRLEVPTRCRPETKLVEGEPAPAVLSAARRKKSQPTLLAVGSRGLGAPKRMILGSVSTRVLREAEGPVLIAPRGSRSINSHPTSDVGGAEARGWRDWDCQAGITTSVAMNSRPRESDFRLRSKAGDEEARRVLPEGKLLRIVSAAKSYRGPRLSVEDLTREGGIGPMRAVDEVDPDKGDRLCIRATWWIGQSVGRKPTGKEEG